MAITFTPGQVVPAADFSALGYQHGGDKSQQQRAPTAAEAEAAKKAAREAAPVGDTEERDPNDPRTHYIKYETNPVTRYHFSDGSYVEARTAPNGTDYEIVAYHQSEPYKQAATKAAAADPQQQTPAQQNEAALNEQRRKNAAWPADQDPRYETDEDRAKRADARIKEQRAEAEKNKPQVIPATINTTSPRMGILVTGPDGTQTVQWVPNENYQKPDPKPITIPGNPRTIYWAEADGTIRAEKNKDYVKPSKLIPHPADPRRMVNVTEDDDGNPVILPVDDKTTIKPADLPVLQSKYGEIAQTLGRLAQELNQRVARQEMTPQERTEAFTAAYKQAETQVSEINSILENSKAIWSGQVQQRGQSLSETQSRRSFASDAAGRAIAAGNQVAQGALPGHGKEIVAGVEALMNMQQRYAQGMGGFRESPEIGLPQALEQARGIGLPGYPMPSTQSMVGIPGTAAGPPGVPSTGAGTNAIGAGSVPSSITPGPPSGADVAAANAATQAQSGAAFGGLGIGPGAHPPSGITNTTDAGGVPREYTPASVTGGGFRGGIEPEPLARPGQGRIEPEPTAPGGPPLSGPGDPRLQLEGMGSALQGAQGYAGAPVAAGGAGMWDPMQAVQGMLGQGGDAAWEEAVRRAAGAFRR